MLAESPLRRAVRYGVVLLAAVASVATSNEAPDEPVAPQEDVQLSGKVFLTADNPTATLRLRVNSLSPVSLTLRPKLVGDPPSLLASEGSAIDNYAQITLATGDGQQQAVWLKRDGTTTGELQLPASSEKPATATFRLSPIAKSTSTGGPVELLVGYEASATQGNVTPTTVWLDDAAP